MKYYLGGGWDDSSVDLMKNYIKNIFEKENISEILHIPFAGSGIRHKTSGWCMPEEFKNFVDALDIKYLNASYLEDIDEFSGDCIYINGGHYRDFLLLMCKKPELIEKLKKARIIISESSGSMILGKYFLNKEKTGFEKGLGLLEDMMIIPHYSTSYNKESLKTLFINQKKNTNCSVLGIDETTFVYFDDVGCGDVIGDGNIYKI